MKSLIVEIEVVRSRTTSKAAFIIDTIINLRLLQPIYLSKPWNKHLKYSLFYYNYS